MFIRPYKVEDKDAVIHIFRETASANIRDAGEHALHYGSHVWCRPYLMLEPTHCFVLDDGNGVAVGYIIGTPDTTSFVRRYRDEYLPSILSVEDLVKPGPHEDTDWNNNITNALRRKIHEPERILHTQEPTFVAQFPAHLHIDILPLFQRKGMGTKLFDVFCAKLRKHNVPGLHRVMASSNVEVGKFYSRMGYIRFPLIIDAGISGELGRDTNGSIWQIRKL